MVPLIFTDRSVGLMSLAAVAVWMGVEYWLAVRDRGHVHERQDQGSIRVLAISCSLAWILCWVIAFRVPSTALPGDPWYWVIAGSIIILLGVWLRVWSVRTLGRFFRRTVMVQGAHRVIEDGPYRYLRHPSYTGFLLSTLGLGFVLGNWLGLVVMLIIVFLAFQQRILVEEAVLSRELGESYQAFMKRTKRLIPFVY
jgi:protein-S-isoprenylcysteine O-methyltransferase Ste14